MRLLKEIGYSVKHGAAALPFANKHRLWKYFWLPAFISLLLFLLLAFAYWQLSAWATGEIQAYIAREYAGSWFAENGNWLTRILILGIFLLLYLKSYRTCMNIFCAPFLGLLAEKVQLIEQPELHEQPFRWGDFLKSFVIGLFISLLNLFIEISLSLLFIFIGLIVPILSIPCTILTVLTEWYFIGFSAIDLRNEFNGETIPARYAIVWRHFWFSVGTGGLTFLLMFVPFIGIFFAPFISVIAAGRGISEAEKAYLKKMKKH